jgi:DNA-directed RNA polymerase subunit alpha
MVLPRRVESEVTEDQYGRFVISPLERGYGFTLGASLKRVMLASLAGASVTSVRVNGGLAAYDEIPGVVEDMSRLLLQAKQVRPKIADRTEGVIRLQLEHKGVGSVHASEIICPPHVRIENPDLYLFTAQDADAQVTIEFAIEQGSGYRSADMHPDVPEGYVPVDANFSPVERVVYDVDPARYRQHTNYDKLILEVWTDGSMTPQEVLSKSAVMMIRHLQVFDPESADILKDPSNFMPPPVDEEPEVNPLYDVPIEVLDLSTRVFNSLRRTGITSVGDVVDMLQRGEDAMLAIRNFGQTSLDELKEKLVENGYLTEEEAQDV